MVRSLMMGFAAALALAAAVSTADAQTVRHRHMHYAAVHPGDIVVHARSYLDPGAGASFGEIGTGDRYVTDSAPVFARRNGADVRQWRLRHSADPLQSARPARAAVRVLIDRTSVCRPGGAARRRFAFQPRRVELVDKGH